MHGKSANSRSPAATQGCQSCHGDASAHVKASGGTKVGLIQFSDKATAADVKSGTCLSCHEGNRNLAFWNSGRHQKQDVSCNNCHSIHGAPKAGASISPYVTTVRATQYETCTTCHREQRSQILKPSHHPIVEGKVKCSDCHNPHGALSPAMLKTDTLNDLCYTCHADKRGPWMNEHPPVAENCANCHVPHGSSHSKLLSERVPSLCQDCHQGTSHVGTIYNRKDTFVGGGGWNAAIPGTTSNPSAGARMIGRSCLNCHTTVHGSNAPGSPGQRFRQ
jgi:DmsE family decaheme c-type cytochrome